MSTSRFPQTLALTIAAAAAALLGACSSTPVSAPAAPVQTPVASTSTAPAPAPRPATSQPAPSSTVSTVTLPAYLDPKNPISRNRSVYFDFDAALLKSEFTAMVEQHGKYLASNPGVAIKVEGNTDERGGAEYNLALGQRRAEAVRQALKLAGAKDSQVEALSWGEERPKAGGHDESAWAQNRRADLVYPAR